MSKIFGLFGAGGNGREIVVWANEFKDKEIYFVDDAKAGQNINGKETISTESFLALESQEKFFNISIADSKVRKEIATMLLNKKCKPLQLKSSTTNIYYPSDIDEGAVFCDFTKVSPNVKIGKFFHCNTLSHIAHDCVIGDFVTFATQVNCNGNIIIEDMAYIGSGAVLRNGSNDRPLKIGKNSTVGMGAVVTKDVEPNSTVIGNPARQMKI